MRFLKLLMQGMAIDLGTTNTIVAIKHKGIVERGPSAVALSLGENESEALAVGADALKMLGRTPGGVQVKYPMREGVIQDSELCCTMLKSYVHSALGTKRISPLGMDLALCLPMCVTSVERRALIETARSIGARGVTLVDEALAAAIGAGLPVYDAVGSMIVDIGGGTSDIAIVALGGVAVSRTIRVGGAHLNDAIAAYISREYGVLIGERTAEDIKRTLGNAMPITIERMQVRGRNIKTGLPESVVVNSIEISLAMTPRLNEIVEAVKSVLAMAPPELAGDLVSSGITLTGGSSLLKGMDALLAKETRLKVYLDESPYESVIRGALKQLEDADGISDDDELYEEAGV